MDDVTRALATAIARLRRARALHPSGLTVRGTLAVHGSGRTGSPLLDVPAQHGVVGRMSKALGTPWALPDAFGLALRVQPSWSAPGEEVVDLLLTTSGIGDHLRTLPFPSLGWQGTYTTVVAFRAPSGPVVVAARGPQRRVAPSLAALGEALEAGPLRFDLLAGSPRRPWQRLGSVILTDAAPDDPALRFDPRRVPPETRPPAFLSGWRAAAYLGSRAGFPPCLTKH